MLPLSHLHKIPNEKVEVNYSTHNALNNIYFYYNKNNRSIRYIKCPIWHSLYYRSYGGILDEMDKSNYKYTKSISPIYRMYDSFLLCNRLV